MSKWEKADTVVTTFGTIKNAQQESFDLGFHTGLITALRSLMEAREEGNTFYEDGLTYAVHLIEGKLDELQ